MTGCTLVTPLEYRPTVARPVAAPGPAVGAVRATDDRKERPKQLGTVMAEYGAPVSMLETERPVADEVAKVFAQGLAYRGEFAPGAPYTLWLAVHRFDADHVVTSQARIALDLTLVDAAGRPVFASAADQVKALQLIGASAGDLRDMSLAVLNRTVDRLLDDPRLQAVLRGTGP